MPRILKTLETIALKFTGGTPASGKVITGDETGNASWNYVSNTNVASNAGIAVSKLEAASPNQIVRAGQTGTPEFAYMAIDVPIGTVVPYMFPNAPIGFLVCDGSVISRTGYADLFALANSAGLIGTVFGAGDGSTTFSLPDMRGRTIVGVGTHSDVSSLGTTDNLAAASRTPRHTHDVPAHFHGKGTIQISNASGSHTHTISDPGHTHGIYGTQGNYGTENGFAHTGRVVFSRSGGPNEGAAYNFPSWALLGSSNTTGITGTTSTNSTHTHGSGDFSGSVGATGGSNGDTALPTTTTTVPYIALNYIIKATYSTLLGDSNAEANEAFTVFMGG